MRRSTPQLNTTESPECYKPAAEVLRAVTDAGLAEVQTRLTPIASIKGND